MHLKSRKEVGSEVSLGHSPPDCQLPALTSSLFVWLWLFFCNVGGLLGSRMHLDSCFSLGTGRLTQVLATCKELRQILLSGGCSSI